jgi:preprotein translocase subunit Sec61beta
MPKDSKNSKTGFQSAAGLIRYFDSEDEKAFKINPLFVLGFALATVFAVELLKFVFPV